MLQNGGQHHPHIIDALKEASARPFVTDDLPHLLFHLAGIKCSYYDFTRNPLSCGYIVRNKIPFW